MPVTVPNQNVVVIHCDKPKTNFLQIKNENWMEFNKKYGPFALQLYLYLAKNADGFQLALSKKAALEEAGIKNTSYYKYLELLINEGYLVWRNGNTLDFYETPHKQEEKNVTCLPSGELDSLQDGQKISPDKFRSSPKEQNFTQSNREIYNTDTTDNLQIRPDSPHQPGEITDSVAKSEQGFNF